MKNESYFILRAGGDWNQTTLSMKSYPNDTWPASIVVKCWQFKTYFKLIKDFKKILFDWLMYFEV